MAHRELINTGRNVIFQSDPNLIRWRIHLDSPPDQVHPMLSTNEGRARFWAESALETGGSIDFVFPDGQSWRGRIIQNTPPHTFSVEYFGGSVANFYLEDDGSGGTDLTLIDEGVQPQERCEVIAGWVSVLLALKAAIDFSIDLRNHDPARTWEQGFADN